VEREHEQVKARMQVVVRGRVQGVNFRRFIAEHARRLRLAGSVRNGDDGASVEIAAEGERTDLERLLVLAHQGPDFARVDSVDIVWSEPEAAEPRFRILP
jgi:acylphosphatase